MADVEHLNNPDMTLMESIILGVAHELNNPNTFIRVNTSNLKKLINLLSPCLSEYEKNHPEQKIGPYTLPEIKAKMLSMTESILDASVRIISIADKLKQSTSAALTEASELSLVETLNTIIGMHRFLIDKTAVFKLTYDSQKKYLIQGHGLQLEQAFSILLTNACDAINEQHKNQTTIQGTLDMALTEHDDKIGITLTDNGCGMKPETMEKIFNPYFTTKAQGVGDGIGLALCKSIIDRHRGKISATSQVGKGSSFEITLPKS